MKELDKNLKPSCEFGNTLALAVSIFFPLVFYWGYKKKILEFRAQINDTTWWDEMELYIVYYNTYFIGAAVSFIGMNYALMFIVGWAIYITLAISSLRTLIWKPILDYCISYMFLYIVNNMVIRDYLFGAYVCDSADPLYLAQPRWYGFCQMALVVFMFPYQNAAAVYVLLYELAVVILYNYRFDVPVLPRGLETFDSCWTGFCATMFLAERHNSPVLLTFLDCMCDSSPLNCADRLPKPAEKHEILVQFHDLGDQAKTLADKFTDYKKQQDSMQESFACAKAVEALNEYVKLCEEYASDNVKVSNLDFRRRVADIEAMEKAVERLEALPDLEVQHRELKNYLDEYNAVMEQLNEHCHRIRKLYAARNRWHLALTLLRNPSLRKYRKSLLYKGPTKAEKILQDIEDAKKQEEADAKKAKCCPCCVKKDENDAADVLNDKSRVQVQVDSNPLTDKDDVGSV